MFRLVFLLIDSFSLANAYELYGVDMRDLSILAKYFSAGELGRKELIYNLVFHLVVSFGLSLSLLFYIKHLLKTKYNKDITKYLIIIFFYYVFLLS
ncbi:hypothetical protein CBLAS_0288 [Campylobacter blaseri]|uniref:Uncharacterized protein n=1 Tax=Campylobacter blaseri TaxID=2042961 RepID=A0A2P8R1B7_9BACT|nr:hypothetical protein [Campylobacter blaseri]PSM52289.1 hypothetical protein CQ405_04345 [Campylobacter blaseri]PSM54055.1 hypothetical protein CRN67_04345 [Campylobacter blaseri]QKF85496.1 hypothetical protein CBLAS_0288 [Campylobacter blaseri]